MKNNRPDKNFEELAKKQLGYFVDQKYAEFELKDTPDLQSRKHDCGVEIVKAWNNIDGIIDNVLYRCIEEKLSKKEAERLCYRKKIKCLFIYNDDKFLAFIPAETEDKKDLKNTAANWIKKKNKKFVKYEQFSKNELFIFCRFTFDESEIEDIIKIAGVNKFDTIYFSCPGDILYVFDYKNKILKTRLRSRNYK